MSNKTCHILNPNDAKLAINGGVPVRTKPWSENLTLGEAEKKAACEVIESGHLSLFEGSHNPTDPFSFWGGPRVQQLEKAWCEYYGCNYAISMNSATSGLSAAIGALGLGFGDEIIVSPYTMSACAVCMLMYGAIPVFADVSLDTGCLDPSSIEERITPRTRAILVIHQFGIPADMDRIMVIAKKHDLKVIEDCAQAHGAKINDRFVGTIGDIGVFSLNTNKTIQTGEGGVCTTNDPDTRYRLALIRNHGESVVEAAEYNDIVNMVGFNYRMTEITAAVAVEQLKRLDYINKAQREYFDYLHTELLKYPCIRPMTHRKHCLSSRFTFTFRYMDEVAGISREEFVAVVNAEGIKMGQGYVAPLYLLPIFKRKIAFKHGYPFAAPENQKIQTNYHKGTCPNAEKLHYKQLVTSSIVKLPHTKDDIRQIAEALDKVFSAIPGMPQ